MVVLSIFDQVHLLVAFLYSHALCAGYQQSKPAPRDYGWQAQKGKGKGKGKGQKPSWGGQQQAVPRQTADESPIDTRPVKKPR